MNLMPTYNAAFVTAADAQNMWLVSGEEVDDKGRRKWRPGDWLTGVMESGGHPFHDVRLMLAEHDINAEDIVVLHQSSSYITPVGRPRPGNEIPGVAYVPDTEFVPTVPHGQVNTHIVVVHRPGFVVDHWPQAVPIRPRAVDVLGKPAQHGPDEIPPDIRDYDRLMLSIKHLNELRLTNSGVAAALDENWVRHLQPLRRALAGFYDFSVGGILTEVADAA